MTIDFSEINFWAVLVVGVSTLMIGGAWYTALFGQPWLKAQGYSEQKVKEMQAKLSPLRFFSTMLVCYLVLALGMSFIIHAAGIDTFSGGATLGFMVWIIVASIGLTGHISKDIAAPGYLIDASFQLIYCVGAGVMLGVWS